MAPDDLISTLLFDISTLTEGKKETKDFIVNSEVKLVNIEIYIVI